MTEQKPDMQQGMAAGLYEIEKLRVKLVIGRLVGIAVAVAAWWFLIPTLHDPGAIIVGLLVALFGGLWVGQMVTLSMVRR